MVSPLDFGAPFRPADVPTDATGQDWRGIQGEVGPQGPAGPPGAVGSAGAAGANGNVAAAAEAVRATAAEAALGVIAAGNYGRNLLHNGLFRQQQRGAGAFTTAVYTADRWLQNLSTSTLSTTLIALADADRTVLADQAAKYALQAVAGGTAGAGDFVQPAMQRIEAVHRLAGKTVTVSFWAKANTGTPKLGLALAQIFGTGGSPSAAVTAIGSASVTLSTTWTRFSASIAVPSVAGKTLGSTAGTDYTQLEFWQSSGATNNARAGTIGVQSYTLSLWGVQLEVGAAASPLEKPDLQVELANCQRFYQTNNIGMWGGGVAAGLFGTIVAFPVVMHVAPTISLGAPGLANLPSIAASSPTTLGFTATGTATATVATAFTATYTATADL